MVRATVHKASRTEYDNWRAHDILSSVQRININCEILHQCIFLVLKIIAFGFLSFFYFFAAIWNNTIPEFYDFRKTTKSVSLSHSNELTVTTINSKASWRPMAIFAIASVLYGVTIDLRTFVPTVNLLAYLIYFYLFEIS